MRKIVITLPYYFKGEAEAISEMLAGGDVWRVHIRKPGTSEQEMRELIGQIPENQRSKITLHEHTGLAKEYGFGGVHLNSRNRTIPEGWTGMVSKSLHEVKEIESLEADYAFLSPIYPSISKPGYSRNFDFEELAKRVNNKIIALGGVTPEKFAEIEELGFGGAAMLGAAWGAEPDRDRFKLQFITNATERMNVEQEAEKALQGGCKWIQLRMKDATDDEIVDAGKRIAEMCRQNEATYIIDDHVELVERTGADGVHLGKNDMPLAEARKVLGPMKIIGATANRFEDIEAAQKGGANYIGLGPYRFTTTKKKLSPVLGLEGYERITEECKQSGIRLPIVAIGGIGIADIGQIMHAGADGIAISGAIINADAPEKMTKEIIQTINANYKTK